MAEPTFLLDTNICIYLLEGTSPAARAKVEQFDPGELAISAVAYGEFMHGLRTPDDIARALRLMGLLKILPFDRDAAEVYAKLPFRRGRYDRLIAAHALSLGATLVTNNPRDFADIPKLLIENWTLA